MTSGRTVWALTARTHALLLGGAALGLCVSVSAMAQAETDEGDQSTTSSDDETIGASRSQRDLRHRPRPDPTEYRSEQYGAFELRFGPYRPRVDSEFDGVGPYEEIFGTGRRYHLGFELDWQIFRIPYLGTLGPGIGFGYTRATARAPLTFQEGLSDEDTSLWIIPLSAVAVLRVDVLAQQMNIPFVPYLKAGLTYALWGSSAGGDTDRHDGLVGRGAETGYQAAVGLMFWLNVLHPQSALDMDNATGINNSYVFAELFASDVNSFGTGMQVGTNTWVVGLAFEF